MRRMEGTPAPTYLFYIFISLLSLAPLALVWHYWHEARTKDWAWTSQDSRTMYVDGAKTLITASGIAVALVASSAVSSARSSSSLVAFSAKVAVVCLISCVCLSMVVIVALLRGFERAQSRYIEEQKKAGVVPRSGQGRLNSGELLFILVPAGLGLSSFLVGFVFLGRVAFHF